MWIIWYTPAVPVTYATRDPINKNAAITLSNWNLTTTDTSDWRSGVRATISKTSWKRYWEVRILNDWAFPNNTVCWICNSSYTFWYPVDINGRWYHWDGKIYHNGVSGWTNTSFTTNDTIWIAWDVDAGTLKFYKNNVLQAASFSGLGSWLFPHVWTYYTNSSNVVNFWATTMAYTAPSWYNQWFYT